jgi:hypothetical protein
VSATCASSNVDHEQQLVETLYGFRHDPLGCVLFSFPWGEPGTELANTPEPRTFQRKFLTELGAHLQNPETRFKPFRKAISSGHGIGKSALLGMIVHWAKSTCLDCKVLITAGTGDQLKTKTQPEISKWFLNCINKHWFDVHVTSIKVNDAEHENRWRTDFQTWSEENPQAFAGAHNAGKRLVIIFEEAAGVIDAIWKVVEGALTDKDTEIIWIAFSQCTRGEGAFYEAVFGDQKHRWRPEVIDSREVEGTNVEEINESIEVYGENSDHVRVRYLGLFPLAGGGKFIDLDLVQQAQHADGVSTDDEPLVAGVDFAWGGSDDNVIRFRKGLDGRSIPPVKVKGHLTREPAIMVGKISDVLNKTYDGEKVAMVFFDSAGIASSVYSGVRALGYEDRIMLVNFGADSPQPHCAYWRDFMWDEMKKWMMRGGGIDKDHDLAADLQKPILVQDRKQRVKLESKEDMKKRLAKMDFESASPDDGDALALTFAAPVQRRTPLSVGTTMISASERGGDGGWMA